MFGTAEKLAIVSDQIATLPPVVILRLRNMTALDSTGMKEFEELADKLHATERTLILCGAREQPAKLIHQAEFEEHIGRENICPNVKMALARAEALMYGAGRAEIATAIDI
jgi:SulP family sulfate permease